MSGIPDEQAALLSAIVAHPEEDTPRLVYADWLQEHGDEEQATFIRDSIELAQMPKDAEGRNLLRMRLFGLEAVMGGDWVKGIGLQVAPLAWDSAGFERGLLTEAVYQNVSDFVAESQTLFARLPVRKLTITLDYSLDAVYVQKFAMMPELTRLYALNFKGKNDRFPLHCWRTLIHSPYLSGLRELSATALGMGDEYLLALAGCANLTSLTSLDLSRNQMTTSDGQLAILRSPHLTRLKKLSLENGDEPANTELINLVVARFGSDAPLLRSLSEQE